ncbi:MAG: hypothetical protein HY286_17860 [Planctomycetes bacterium]|nr:hypothetical protein [Planctomycetota bacterium]
MRINLLLGMGFLCVAGIFVFRVTGQGDAVKAMPAEDVGSVNRYQLVHTQDASDTILWMIDTASGRVWRRYIYPDGDHWTQTVREDYPAAFVRLQGMPPKPPASK